MDHAGFALDRGREAEERSPRGPPASPGWEQSNQADPTIILPSFTTANSK